ncbi:Pentatricopeptide repeat-containing protein [Seminavis robusta]|uniref:Pentatricopeptide repeat-containing protein n=1 Tax=Seminavis robusta TaxID=568900 RepID=A0A9N8EJ49_9STRA|nr:Pentatricopeptide repeat-containing protein [Seminavis robusta]|eukprot:Sro1017_g231730.1 Pentatricopeptide repeat-containing protein (1058) ;mRNA; f:12332-16031
MKYDVVLVVISFLSSCWSSRSFLPTSSLQRRQGRRIPTKSPDGITHAYKDGNTDPKFRRKVRGRQPQRTKKQHEFAQILKPFRTPQEIDAWMQGLVTVQQRQSNNTTVLSVFPPTSWSSRDETDFIRFLRDRQAFLGLELFACHLARQNVFVYTAAISSLATSKQRNVRNRVHSLLQSMDDAQVLPSALTFAALFQATDGPEEAKQMMTRLQHNYQETTWSVEAFHQAILACARTRKNSRHKPSNKSWQTALEFTHNLRRNGLTPNVKTYSSLLHVCARTGQLRIAMSLMKELQSTTSLTANQKVWTNLLNVCAVAGDYSQANQVIQTMQTEGHAIKLAHCSALLKALSKHGMVELSMALLDMMTDWDGTNTNNKELQLQSTTELVKLRSPVAPDLVALNTILASCAKAGDFEAARALLDRMKNGEFHVPTRTTQPIYPDEISYSLLLSSCRDTSTARGILKEMHLSRRHRVGVVRPNQITYARLIAVCTKADVPDIDTARFFLESARKDGIEPTVFMYTAAIWTAEKTANYTVAREFWDEMKQERVVPNAVSYSGVISAAARAGLMHEAITLYREMKSAGCSPTVATYNALALACKYSKTDNKLVQLEGVFKSMDSSDLNVDVGGAVIEALIAEYGRQGSYERAKQIFDKIEGPSNGPCLRAMLSACATAGSGSKWEEAIAMLHSSDITATAIGPGEMDQGALSNAMIACSKADRWQEGLNLLQLYGVNTESRYDAVSIVALNSLMGACGRKGRPDIAIDVLNSMERRYGVKPDEHSYRSVIIGCNQAEHQRRRQPRKPEVPGTPEMTEELEFEWWECCLALLRRMKEDGLKPDIQTLSSCISACEAAGQWQRAVGILQTVIDNADEDEEEFLNLFCFNAAISSCEKGGAWVEALEIYERMVSYGGPLQPNFVTLSSLVLALANAGQKELAQSKYRQGFRMNIVNPWRTTKDSQGKQLKAMDLHLFNRAMACSAIRSHLDSLLARGDESQVTDSLVVIVGKGLRSQEGVKLLPVVEELLSKEYGIVGNLDGNNSGRLVIDAETLRSLVASRSFFGS